jgi:SAM-dependent methyltransferase
MSEWEAEEGEHWATNADRYTRMLGGFGDVVLAAASVEPGERVLDVGCGCGDISLAAAAAVTGAGAVVGVDLSPAMLGVARKRAAGAGLIQASFVQADAATFGTDNVVDVTLSRFGVMFFEDPTCAFANIRASMRPGARLVFVCWQQLFDNDWMVVPGAAVAELLPLPSGVDLDGPGPFAFADAERTGGMLSAAAFRDAGADAVSAKVWMGKDATDAVEFLSSGGLARAVFEGAEPAVVAQATERVREVLAGYETADGVLLDGAAWVVTATA